MDHIPNLWRPVYPHIEVPYILDEQYRYVYDNQGFKDFPERHGWDSDLFLKGDFTFNGVVVHNRAASLIQAWLYFGLMAEVFQTNIDTDEFVRVKDGRRVVTTKRLSESIDRWQDHRMAMREEERQKEIDRLDGFIHKNFIYFDSCIEGDIMPHQSPVPISQEVQLSIAILFSTLCLAKMHVFPTSDSKFPRYTNKLVVDRLKRDGWCGSDIALLFEGGLDTSSVLELYFASLLGPRQNRNDHSSCPEALCLAYQIDDDSYRTKHLDDCTSCPFLEVPPARLCSIIDRGHIPIVTLSRLADGGALQIDVMDATPGTEYVAITHVYADGLGNRRFCGLPHCQLDRLQQRVNSLYTVDDAPLPEARPFWMDTLCIPVQPKFKEQRDTAIIGMGKIYEQADRVLVLNSEFEHASRHAAAEEVFMRITSNSWFRRIWTLEEGVLARSLHFQFGDGALDLEHMLRQIPLHEDRFSVTTKLRAQSVQPYYKLRFFRDTPPRERIRQLYAVVQWRSTSHQRDLPICFGTLLGVDISSIVEARDEDKMKAFVLAQREFPVQALFFLEARMSRPGLGWQLQNFSLRSNPEFIKPRAPLGFADDEGFHVALAGFTFSPASFPSGGENWLGFGFRFLDEGSGVWYNIQSGLWLADPNQPRSWADVLVRLGTDSLGVILEDWPLKHSLDIDPTVTSELTSLRDLLLLPGDVPLDEDLAATISDFSSLLSSNSIVSSHDRTLPSQTRGALVAITQETQNELFAKFCGRVVVSKSAVQNITEQNRGPIATGSIRGVEQKWCIA